MSSYINEHGKLILTGEDAVKGWLGAISILRENRKLHYKTTFQDLPVSVENRKGSVRSGTGDDGEEWKTKMKVPYGYIPGTEGVDGDALDVFIGPDEDSAYAYVIHCNTEDGKEFDEDKIMLGFSSKESAKKCFKQHYDDDSFFGGIDEIPMWKFRTRAFVKKETSDGPMKESEGASLQVPEDYFEADQAGRDTDQIMKRSILGRHRDQMIDPQVREHGVLGQRWGVRKPDLENDPRTMNLMQVVRRSQPQLNAIRVWQKNRAIRLARQGQQQPPTHQLHGEVLKTLGELGWKAIEAGARLSGMEASLGVVKSVLQHKDGGRAELRTKPNGNSNLRPESIRKRRSSKTESIESFMESKGGTYYARSMGQYGTDTEESDLDAIEESFGKGINSPKTKRHADLGMGYFHKKIDAAKRVVIRPARKRRITAGVFSEAVHALKNKKPVYAIYRGKMRRVKSVEALDNPNNEGHFGKLIFKKRRKSNGST